MNQIAVRGGLCYCGLSVTAFLLRETMLANGMASHWNPAWHLVDGIYKLFRWSWWLAIVVAAIAAVLFVLFEIVDRSQNQKLREQEAVRSKQREIEWAKQREIEAKRERSRNLKQKIIEKRNKEERERKEQAYRQYLQKRTPQEAAEAALNDFCQGDR